MSQASALIDLDAIASNLALARSRAPNSQVMAIIKANAYGHGAVEVARHLQSLSQPPSSLGLARLSEAVILREAGIKGSLCLLEGVTTPEELELAAHLALDLVVHSPSQLQGMKNARQGQDYPGGVWLKVDTGMGRLGFKPEQIDGAVFRFSAAGVDDPPCQCR